MRLFLAAIAGVLLIVSACADDAEETLPEETASNPSPEPIELLTPTPSAPSLTQATQTSAAPAPASSPDAGMTRFTHAKYGYSFDYPSDWIVDPNATDEYLAVYRDYPGTGADKIEFVILDNAELLPLEEWISKQEVSAPIKMTSESTVEWSVDGAPGTRKVASAQGFTFHVAYLAIRDKVLIVNGPWTDSSMVVDLEKLLSTLRLNQ